MIVLLFRQPEQPTVYKGNIAAATASAIQAGLVLLILYLSTRDAKREALEQPTFYSPGPETPIDNKEDPAGNATAVVPKA